MRLRERFTLTLVVITVILIAPAAYSVNALYELRRVADHLRTRDAVGALALGRLQTAARNVEDAERVYLALAAGADREKVRGQVLEASGEVEHELAVLASRGYRTATRPALAAWARLKLAVAEEQRLVESGAVEAADRHRASVVDPAFAAMDRSLDPISTAIEVTGEQQRKRAEAIADTASTTALLALAVALALALAVAGALARTILRPIHELRRATAVIAEGDFEPELRIAPDRRDEIGDLARSFRWMAVQLQELERLRAEFVSVASHELKTPLSVIKGYVSLLQDGIYGEVPQEQQKVLAAIGDQGDRLGRLIQQLLDVSRFEAGGARLHIQPVELRPFVSELAVSFEALAVQNDIHFEVDVDPALPETLPADPDRLNEVVGNLLSNAFKFTPRHGTIRLRATRGSREDDPRVMIEVADTGVGIPQENLPRIFEKFYQVENEAQPLSVGSGLGLAISREIVEAHGGTITAESKIGHGTTFRVFLPITSPPPRRPEPAPAGNP